MNIKDFPFEVFNLLNTTNTNKELYLKILLIIYEEYKTCYESLEKETCISMILNSYREELIEYKSEDTGFIIPLFESLEQGKAKELLNNLIKNNWLEEIDEVENLKTKIILPKHSLELISSIDKLINPNLEETELFITSIFNNLKSVVEESTTDDIEDIAKSRYYSLISACDKSKEFNQYLNTMISDIKNYYQKLLEIKTTKDIMKEHFEIYAQEFTNVAYNKLKTKDNLYKYKSKILDLLNEISFNDEIIDSIVNLIEEKKKYEFKEEAYEFVYNTIDTIKHIFDNLEKNIFNIDKKHKEYVNVATSRMQYIQNRNKNICNDIFKLIEIIKEDSKVCDIFSDKINIFSFKSIEDNSLYIPNFCKNKKNIPQEIDLKEESQNEIQLTKQKFTKKEIEIFINELLKEKDQISILEININSDKIYHNLIMSCFYSSKGNVNFNIEFADEEEVIIGKYTLPNLIIKRGIKNE